MAAPAEACAIPFIVEDCDSEGNDILCITEDARAALEAMEGPICVVCTSGGQGVGKSELLNRAILGSSASGFPVGGTTGIWMWSKPIKAQASDGSDVNLLLLDAAGTVNERSFSGSFEINADIESSGIINNLQTIAFLLSSCWVYESMGSLSDAAISDLASTVTSITRQVRVGPALQDDVNLEDLATCSPKLMWVLRDVLPSQLLDDQGRILTSRQCLERAVRSDANNSFSPTKSRAKAIVRMCFEDRECFPLSPALAQQEQGESSPGAGQNMSSEYMRQMQVFGGRILQTADPKTVNGLAVTGSMLAMLADNYVTSSNSESRFSIKDAWDCVCDAECERAMQHSVEFYQRMASNICEQSLPLPPHDLTQWHAEAAGESVRMFDRGTKGKEGASKYVSLLEERLRSSFRSIDAENHRVGCLKAKDALETLYAEVDSRLSDGMYSDFGAFERDRARIRAKFLEEVPRNMHSMLVLHEFMEEKVAGAATKFLNKSSEVADDSRSRLEAQVETMRFGVMQQQRGLERELQELKERLVLQEEYLAAGRQREAELRSTLTCDREKHSTQLVEINQAHSRALQDAMRECEEAERRRIDSEFRLREAETRMASLSERRAPVPSKRKSTPSTPNNRIMQQEARTKEVLGKVMSSLRGLVSSNAQLSESVRSAAAGVTTRSLGEIAALPDWADASEDAGLVEWCDITLDALKSATEGLQRKNDEVLRVVKGLAQDCKVAGNGMKSPAMQVRPSGGFTPAPGDGAPDDSIMWYSPLPVGQTPGPHRATPGGGGLLRRAVGTPARDALRVTPFSQPVASSPWAVHSAQPAPSEAPGSAKMGKVALFSPQEALGGGGILSPGLARLPAMHEVDSSSDSLQEGHESRSMNMTAGPSPRSKSPVSDRASSPINTLEASKFPGLGGRLTPTESSPPPAGAGALSADSSRDGPQSSRGGSASPDMQMSKNSPPQTWSASTVGSAGGRSVGVGPQKEQESKHGSALSVGGGTGGDGGLVHTQEALFEPVALDGVSGRIEVLERTMFAMRQYDQMQAASEETLTSDGLPQHPWWCVIGSCSTKTSPKGNRMYTEYDVRVGTDVQGPVRLGKRYSHFLELHRKLQRTFPHVAMPTQSAQLFSGLRSSMWFNRFDPEFVECRRVWLEAYTQAIFDTPQLAQSTIFQSFIQTDLVLEEAVLSLPSAGAVPATPVRFDSATAGGGCIAPPPTQIKRSMSPVQSTHSPTIMSPAQQSIYSANMSPTQSTHSAKRAGWQAPPPTSVKQQQTFSKWQQQQEEWQEENGALSQTMPLHFDDAAHNTDAAPKGAFTPQPSISAAAALRQARQNRLTYSPLSVVAPTQ